MAEELRRRQHLVSKGYQRNFAHGDRVAIVDATTARIVDRGRPIKRNWTVPDFLSVVSAAGEVDDSLEREFGQRERVFLNVVREIEPFTPLAERHKNAIDCLAAAHLVRSVAFALVHAELVSRVVSRSSAELGRDERAVRLFARDRGRLPRPGELEGIVSAAAEEFAAQPDNLALSMRRLLPGVEAHLGQFSVQLVGADDHLPGFVLSDHPILHGKRREGRFGFRDAGAVGDADIIIVPLRRHAVALYSAQRLPDVRVKTKAGVRWINSLLIRGAGSEVACHPEDALETSRLVRGIDRYPARGFDDKTIR